LLGCGIAGIGLLVGADIGYTTGGIAGIALGVGKCAASLGLLIATPAILVQKNLNMLMLL
jgi:hypothetical protein